MTKRDSVKLPFRERGTVEAPQCSSLSAISEPFGTEPNRLSALRTH